LLRERQPTQVYDKVISAPVRLGQRAPVSTGRCVDAIRKIRPMARFTNNSCSYHTDGLNAN